MLPISNVSIRRRIRLLIANHLLVKIFCKSYCAITIVLPNTVGITVFTRKFFTYRTIKKLNTAS
jgi:hypothetical protein